MHYYNDHDPAVCAWLRELIARGLLPEGNVDERSILDVRPADLAGYTGCHFFAGIGGWAYALRLAGWPDDRPVWTGSAPCQPFSAAGKRAGYDDERHRAPVWLDLIRECRPAIVLGEQVTSAAGRDWLADLRAEMETVGYAVGAADLCAASVGAPHIRQRLWFGAVRLGEADDARPQERRGRLAHTDGGQPRQAGPIQPGGEHGQQPADRGAVRLADVERGAAERHGHSLDAASRRVPGETRQQRIWADAGDGDTACRPGPADCFWRDADWLHCRDEKWRPVEPGTFPLADGLPARVVRLRGYGNAIVPQVAAEFVTAFLAATEAAGQSRQPARRSSA